MKPDKYPKSHEIIYLEASINYTIIYLRSGHKLLSSLTLKHHATHELLQSFVRVHKSFLLNPHHIIKLQKAGNKLSIQMSDGRELQVSRRRKTLVGSLNL